MTILSAVLLAAITVAPSDRLAMADRLFNRGRYADAEAEYRSLVGEKGIAEDELLFRLAECDRALAAECDAVVEVVSTNPVLYKGALPV